MAILALLSDTDRHIRSLEIDCEREYMSKSS